MRKRMGRPVKEVETEYANITMRIPGRTKNLIAQLADGYDMTITEYLLTLVSRDAAQTPEG
jgi:uncharacterized protein (DUF1778 family)